MRRKGRFTVLIAGLLASSAGAQTPAVVQITVRMRALLETDEGQRAGRRRKATNTSLPRPWGWIGRPISQS